MTNAEPVVEFFFDVGSPYSYLAATQLHTLEGFSSAKVRWRPFLVGGVFKAAGNDMPARVPAKAKYMLADLQTWAKEYGVELNFPASFPPNTLKAQRALTAAARIGEDSVRRFALGLFRAYWVEGRDVSDAAVLGDVAAHAGLDAPAILASLDNPEIKDALRRETEEAVERGAFGAPTFFIGDRMFWGNDRLQFVEAHLRALEE
ncbi:MAG: 2-hydroxychromene-2-carboxylate isomerase [Polyangiales bacterium]|nr:2-hydroxychromene-2-carboxylate isomerase [Myxococcales bacterium]